MEKLVYVLRGVEGGGERAKNDLLGGGGICAKLIDAGVMGLQVNVVDDAVSPAAPTRIISSDLPMDAMVTFWLHTAIDRGPAHQLLADHFTHIDGYLVTESEPMRHDARQGSGQRSPGYNQVVFLRRPEAMSFDDWIAYWHGVHAALAPAIQSNFRYVQNLITRPLTKEPASWDAIVEECFPDAAMTNRQAFYDAVGDEEKYKDRERQMIESCSKFIDFQQMDCIPSSEYICSPLPAA